MKRRWMKRTISLLICVMLLGLFLALPTAIPVSAEGEGYWEFLDARAEGSTSWSDGWNKYEYVYQVISSPGKYVYKWECVEDYYSASGSLINFKGDSSTVTATNTAPPSVITGNETVSIDVVLTGHYQEREKVKDFGPFDYSDQSSINICVIYNNNGNDYGFFRTGNPDETDTLYTSKEHPTLSRTVSFTFRSGKRDGEEMEIRVSSVSGAQCHYSYVWHSGQTPPGSNTSGTETSSEDATETEESAYYWRYAGQTVREYPPAGTTAGEHKYVYEDDFRKYEWTWWAEKGGYGFRYSCIYDNSNDYDWGAHERGECAGEEITYKLSMDDIKIGYLPGESLNLNMAISAAKSKHLCRTIYARELPYLTINPSGDDPTNTNGRYIDFISDDTDASDLVFVSRSDAWEENGVSKAVHAAFPDEEDSEEGDVVYFVLLTEVDQIQYYTAFQYIYTEGEPAIGYIGINGDGMHDDGLIFGKIDRKAWETAGNDNGVFIPIVILGGAGAAAAAAAGASKKKNKKNKKSSQLKMIVRKDFGDAIRKGEKEVGVYAFMKEVLPDGTERDREELTRKITFYSGTKGLIVKPIGYTASCEQGCLVSVPDSKSELHTGIVSVRFTDVGGYFDENIEFRLIGEPYLAFPVPNTNPVEYKAEKTMLSGDGKTYHINVELCDFFAEPTYFNVEKSSYDPEKANYAGVSFERTGHFSYVLHIANYSPVVPVDGFSHAASSIDLNITVMSPSEKAEGFYRLTICPEGISVLAPEPDDQQRIVINTEDADPAEGAQIKPTGLKLLCTYRRGGEIVTETKGFKLSGLEPTDARTKHIVKGFEYEVNYQCEDLGVIYIMPKTVIPVDPENPYLVTLPVAHPAGGLNYETKIAVRLDGEAIPKGRLLDWDVEHDLLLRTCQRYGISSSGKAKALMRYARSSDISVSVMRQIRRAILEEAHEYYEKEAEEMTKVADELDRALIVLQTTKWFGDQAFSFVIKYYCPNYGDLVELILMPIKDVMCETIGQVISYSNDGGADLSGEFTKQLIENGEKAIYTTIDNAIFGWITAVLTGGKGYLGTNYGRQQNKPGKATICVVIAGYVAYVWWNHYNNGSEDEKGDLGLSLANAIKDISLNGLIKFFSYKFGDYIAKNGNPTRRNAADGSTVYDAGVGSWFDKTILTPILDKIKGDNTAIKEFTESFIDNVSIENIGKASFDAFLDVVVKTAGEGLTALFTGDSVKLKCGDAEIEILSTVFIRIICDFVCRFFERALYVLCLPYKGILWLLGINENGEPQEKNMEITEPCVPYTPDKEAGELLSHYNAEQYPGLNAPTES